MLIFLSFYLKEDYMIFDQLVFTIGFITMWILRCIFRSSMLIYLSFSLKNNFMIFDQLFIIIGFITIWILICIFICSLMRIFLFEERFCDLWSLVYHYRIYHYLDSQMYFNYSSLLIHLLVSLKKGFVIFDQLFITIGFITEFILRCIYNVFLLTL